MFKTIMKNLFSPDAGVKLTNLNTGYSGFLSTDAKLMLQLVNTERMQKRRNALKWSDTLAMAANLYSREMFVKGFFSHRDLNGKSHYDRITRYIDKSVFTVCGENLAINSDFQSAHKALCKSKGHYQNIIHHNYSYCGIGIFSPYPQAVWITQLFIG